MASDDDTTPFFFALAGDFEDKFLIDEQTGAIVTQETLDYEQTREYPNLILIVFDVDFMQSNATISIEIEDENDNAPEFENVTAQIAIPELIPIGSEVFIAMATDLDDTSNSQLRYSFDGGNNFLINALSGAITVDSMLDFEMERRYILDVTATDSGSPALSSSLILIVEILDQNDNPPSITNPLPVYCIRENGGIGEFVGTVNATDEDSGDNAILSFTIRAGIEANHFLIDRETGDIFTNANIDREEQSIYSLIVEVSNIDWRKRDLGLAT